MAIYLIYQLLLAVFELKHGGKGVLRLILEEDYNIKQTPIYSGVWQATIPFEDNTLISHLLKRSEDFGCGVWRGNIFSNFISSIL